MSTSHDERLISGHAGRMLLLLTVGLGVIKLTRYVLPPLLPSVVSDLAITPFEAGVALSLINVAFAIQQFPSGRLSDLLSRKTVLLASLGCTTLGCLLLAVAPSYAVFLLGTAVVGTGGGLFPSASRAWLSELFTARRGEAFGVHFASVDVAGIAASGLAVVVLAVATWRAAFLPIVASLAAVVLLLHLWSTEPVVVTRVDLDLRATVGRVFAVRRTRWLVVALSAYVFVVQGVTGFIPTYLQAETGLDASAASLAFATLFVTGMVVKPLHGRLSDLGSRPLVGAVGLVVGAVGVGLLVVAQTAAVAVAGVVVFAAGHKGFSPTMEAHLMDEFDAESMGGDLGAARTVYWAVGSIGPAYVGYVSSVAGYRGAFLGVVAVLLTGAGVAATLAFTDRP